MSYLIRTSTGRNNIAWGGGTTTKAKYLQRTSTGRNNISWIDISTNGTRNILERTSTSGRNNIRWSNVNFSFQTPFEKFASSITWGNIYGINGCASLGWWSIYDKSQKIVMCGIDTHWDGSYNSAINFQPYNDSNMNYLKTVKYVRVQYDNRWTSNTKVNSVYRGEVDGGAYCEIKTGLLSFYFYSGNVLIQFME